MVSDKSVLHAKTAVITTCIMLFTWVGLCWNTLSLYAAPITNDWGILRSEFMLIFTIMSMGNAIMNMFFYGKLQEKLGARKLLLICGPVATLGFLLIAVSSSLVTFYIGGILFGCAVCGLNNNPVTVIISEWHKTNVGKLIGLAQTVGSVSGILFTLLFTFLIAAFGWKIPLWITVAVSAAAVAIIAAIYKGSPDELGEHPVGIETESKRVIKEDGCTFKEMFKTPQFYLLSIGYLIVPLVLQGALSNIPLLAVDFGFSNFSGTIYTVALIASAVFMIPGGAIIDNIGTKWFVWISVIMFSVSMLLLKFSSGSMLLMYIIAALIGASYDAATIAFGISVREAFGSKEYGKKLGIVAAFVYIALALGPVVMSLFYDAMGTYDTSYIPLLIAGIIGAVLICLGTKRVALSTSERK